MYFKKHLLFLAPDGTGGGDDPGNADPKDGDKKQVPLATLLAEREKRQEAERQLQALNDAKRQADEAKLIEEGKLKEAFELKVKEFDEFKKSIEEDLKLASEFRIFQTQRRDKIKGDLGDKWVESFQNISLSDLEVLAEKLKAQPATQTNNGTGAPVTPESLTAEEKEEAGRMGLSNEGYIQYKKTRNKLKPKETK